MFEDVFTRIRDKAVDFQNHRNDISWCGPARASIQTGLFRINHGLNSADEADYYAPTRCGTYSTKLFDSSTSQDHGPYEFDLALQLGLQLTAANPSDATGLSLLAQRSVAPTSQGSVIGRRTSGSKARNSYNSTTGRHDGTIGRGDSADDLQARTGCKTTWLSQAGIQRLGMFGKNQNGTGMVLSSGGPGAEFRVADGTGSIPYAKTNRFIPPGYTDFCGYRVNVQNHTDSPTVELFNATNPGSGYGAVGDNYEYIYRYPITGYTYSGGNLVVTFSNPNTNASPGFDTLINVGDEVGIDECPSAAWNFGALTVTGVTTQNSGGGTITITHSNPGGSPGDLTNARICPHKMFCEQVMATKLIAALATVNDSDSWLFQYGSWMPHAAESTGSGLINNADSLQAPKRYELDGYSRTNASYGAIWLDDFAYWKGVAGTYSPAVDPTTVNDAHKKNWAQRQHMLAAANDAIVRMLDYCDNRWGENGYIVILTTDNGFEVGEHGGTFGESSNVWSPIGGKVYVYDGSERLFCWMKHPQYDAQVVTFNTWCGDIAPTNMDLFANNVQFYSLRSHHCHDKRDAKSLLRLLDDDTDVDRDRLMFGYGQYKQSASYGGFFLYDPQTQYKLLRAASTPSTREMYDMTPDPTHPCGGSDDWETVNIDDGPGGVADDMSTAMDSMKKAGWDSTSQANNCKTIRV